MYRRVLLQVRYLVITPIARLVPPRAAAGTTVSSAIVSVATVGMTIIGVAIVSVATVRHVNAPARAAAGTLKTVLACRPYVLC